MDKSVLVKIEPIQLPTAIGQFELTCYQDTLHQLDHLALTKGDVSKPNAVLVRIHSECLTGDVFHSQRCDCGEQLEAAMVMIEKAGCGAILYLRQEGRGIGLVNKLKAYKLQEEGADTVEANVKLGFCPDLRDYEIGALILEDLGIQSLDLMTNNPAKVKGLEKYGIKIRTTVPVVVSHNPFNKHYLNTKVEKMGHTFKKKL